MSQQLSPGVYYRYSKSSAFYQNTKKSFFSDNDALLERVCRQNALYASQPARTACKLCQACLPAATDFTSHGIGYTFCTNCSHLNGNHEDTRSFIEQLYIADAGREYSNNYIDDNFVQRTRDIYVPKIDFLLESLPPVAHRLLDVGCGGGYLVYAALLRGLPASGIDVSQSMIDFGNRQIAHFANTSPLRYVDERAFYQSVVTSDADIISAIGVIEHLREPQELFKAFAATKATHLYYSVPMFSFSVILENIFREIFPRHLSGGHTHLFTEDSLRTMNSLIGVTPVAEWRFGTDVTDLYRSALTSLRKKNVSSRLIEKFEAGFVASIDALQAVLDRDHFCSEIHCVTRKTLVSASNERRIP
jgi:SAM-dependent methyltransferase